MWQCLDKRIISICIASRHYAGYRISKYFMAVVSLALCKCFALQDDGARSAVPCLVLLLREGLLLPCAQWWRCPHSMKGFEPNRNQNISWVSALTSPSVQQKETQTLLDAPQKFYGRARERGRYQRVKCWLLPNPEQNSYWFRWTQLFIFHFQGWGRLLNVFPQATAVQDIPQTC